jgi:hypothetical protein
LIAPYVIRDPQGYWHDYQLETTTDQPGISMIVYLQSGETLDCSTILNALKPALNPAPAGKWYRITVAERNIRTKALTTAPIVMTLKLNNQVQVSALVDGPQGKWGKVMAIKLGEIVSIKDGYIYMASLKEVM